MITRPTLDGWLIVPSRAADGALHLTPECKQGHPFVTFRNANYSASWRGDMWMLCTCRDCRATYIAYLSTGSDPLIHCFAVPALKTPELHRMGADVAIKDVMLLLGYARPSYVPPATSPGRARFLEEEQRRAANG
jgi:hypothetical protein